MPGSGSGSVCRSTRRRLRYPSVFLLLPYSYFTAHLYRSCHTPFPHTVPHLPHTTFPLVGIRHPHVRLPLPRLPTPHPTLLPFLGPVYLHCSPHTPTLRFPLLTFTVTHYDFHTFVAQRCYLPLRHPLTLPLRYTRCCVPAGSSACSNSSGSRFAFHAFARRGFFIYQRDGLPDDTSAVSIG